MWEDRVGPIVWNSLWFCLSPPHQQTTLASTSYCHCGRPKEEQFSTLNNGHCGTICKFAGWHLHFNSYIFSINPKEIECQNYKNIYQRTALYMENNNYCTTSNILLTHRKLIPMWIHHMHAGCANMFEHERDGFDRSYIYKAAFMMQ